jgi:hypothetical protein
VARPSPFSRPARVRHCALERARGVAAFLAAVLLVGVSSAPVPAAGSDGDPDATRIAAASAALLPPAARPQTEARRSPDASWLQQAIASAAAQPGRAVLAPALLPPASAARAGIGRWMLSHASSTSLP